MQFEDIGKHCTLCKRKDFLPFKCSGCSSYFCKDHIKPHICTQTNADTTVLIECPLCSQSFPASTTIDPNISWEQHYADSCVNAKLRCKQCNASMSEYKAFKCKYCANMFCGLHREKHMCDLPTSHEICPLCKKVFGCINDLIAHSSIHSK